MLSNPNPQSRSRYSLLLLSLLLFSLGMGGCASSPDRDPRDPWEPFNRGIHTFNQGFDKNVLRPIAQDYSDHMPNPIQTGVSNFFSNLNDVIVVLNDVLQLKFAQAASDFSRLAWNTTAGLFGILDVASHMDLPKHQEDFGQTLAYWGVPDGPYFVIPFLGPSTVRDTVGVTVDIYTNPIFHGLISEQAEANWGATGLRLIDLRTNILDLDEVVEKSGIDPYIFLREAYLQNRRSLIFDGLPPEQDFISEDPGSPEDAELELELELELEKDLNQPTPASPAGTPSTP